MLLSCTNKDCCRCNYKRQSKMWVLTLSHFLSRPRSCCLDDRSGTAWMLHWDVNRESTFCCSTLSPGTPCFASCIALSRAGNDLLLLASTFVTCMVDANYIICTEAYDVRDALSGQLEYQAHRRLS